MNDWPPEFRCENCGSWRRAKPGILARLFLANPLPFGQCINPVIGSMTARSYICRLHTDSATADIGPSLRALQVRLTECSTNKEAP